MTLLESITLLEGNTKGSVIENMGKFRAHKNVVGAMYLEGVYVPFPAWPMGLWNSVCLLAGSEQNYYELLVNSQSVFRTLHYQGQHRAANGENLLLMGRFKKGKFEHSMFGSLTDVNIWDSNLSLEEIKQWKSFSPTVRGNINCISVLLVNVLYLY